MGKIAINIATGTLQQKEMIVGIDLGTTNSLVAIIHPDTRQPVALKEHNAASLVPSIIHFGKDASIAVGEEARQFLVTEPENTIFSAKRLLGKTYGDVAVHSSFFTYRVIDDPAESLVKVVVGNKFFSPVDLSSYILKELKHRAEHILKTPVTKAVITVPAYFNDAQRQATRDAGKLAGLDVLRIINEPTAASLAYGMGLKNDEEHTIAVYDLGGGTFDISILKITNGVFEVLSTNGDTYLGGDDFDRFIMEYWLDNEVIAKADALSDKAFLQELRLKAETAKRELSVLPEYETEIQGTQLKISREKFDQLIAPLIAKTIDCCRNAMADAELGKPEIDAVIMVGGSTRVPAVKDAVSRFFEKEVNDRINPDEVVALGAAIQADIMAGNNRDLLLLDITPLSLGIETMGGLMDVMIPRNSKIPTSAARQYTTQKDGQAGIRISVFQGERDLVRDNRKLAEFNLGGIPGMPAGMPKVEVRFLLNADGILQVRAKELRSGIEQTIDVKPQNELTDSEVERMLRESISHAQADISLRALVEAQTEAGQLLATTENFVIKNTDQLKQDELEETAAAMQALQLALTMKDKDLIRQKMEALNDTSRAYAERIMDIAVANALRNKSI